MQASDITLNVDTLNDGTTIVAEDFTRAEEYDNKSVYYRDDDVPELRRRLHLFRTFPKSNGNFKGTQKSAIKQTFDVSVEGVDSSTSITAPLIINVEFSVPVGATVADILLARQRIIALLDNDTIMDKLNKQLIM